LGPAGRLGLVAALFVAGRRALVLIHSAAAADRLSTSAGFT
jgi:hypothetical protein